MIVIIGASGAVGTPAIPQILRCNCHIRALTSNPVSAEKLKGYGVQETVIGDFRRDEDVACAVAGARSVLFIPPAMAEDQAEIGKRAVAAAKDAKVDHFVFISCVHAPLRSLAHHWHKLQIEEALLESNLNYTILQPAMFMQNLHYVWHKVKNTGVMPSIWDPAVPCNLLDVDDLAEIIAISLTTPRLINGTFEICSGEVLSMQEAAALIGELWGRPVKAVRQDKDEFIAEGRAIGLPEWRIQNMINMSRHYDEHGFGGGNPLVATAILGRAPRSYRDFAKRFLTARGESLA